MGCHIGVIYFTRRLYGRYKISIKVYFTVNKKDGDTALSRDSLKKEVDDSVKIAIIASQSLGDWLRVEDL